MLARDTVLPHRVRRLAETAGEAEAIVDVAGGAVSWAELSDGMTWWARALAGLGVTQHTTVATMLPAGIDAYRAWLGIGWLRAVEVTVSTAYRGEMLRYVLDDAQPRVLVVVRRSLERVAAAGSLPASLAAVVVPDAEDATAVPDVGVRTLGRRELATTATGGSDMGAGPSRRDTAAVIYTSGTTGPSKGVVVPWAELDQGPSALPADLLAPGESYYSTYPTAHLSGKFVLAVAAAYEARLVLRDGFSVSAFWHDVRRFDAKGVGLAGPMASLLMTAPERHDDADNPLDHVTMAPIIAEVEAFKRRFGISRVRTTYGSTELGWPLVSAWNPDAPGSCGRRRVDSPYEVAIVDGDDEPVPVGTVGELVVRPRVPWVMNQGYWRKPQQTAEAWRNGWFHTGDGFREDEHGDFFFVDRIKDALRRRGENISSFEVEAGIAAHPHVEEVAVVGVPSDHGEDDVLAAIVPVAGCELDPAELIRWLEPRMPRFMVPRYVRLVEALPKTDGTLRVKKAVLRDEGLDAGAWDREAAGIALARD